MTDADRELAALLARNPELSVATPPAKRPMPDAARQAMERLQPMCYRFQLPLPPSTNDLYVPVARGRLVLSKAARQYKTGAGLVMQAHGYAPFKGKVWVQVDIYRAHGDVDNFAKCLLDTFTGICYRDDKQITHLGMDLHDELEPQQWRVEVEIRQVQP